MAVPLWSVASGFIIGMVSLAVSARKRWPFVLVPVITATLFLVWKLPGSATSTSLIELLGYTLVFGGILLLQFLAGFGIATLGAISVKSISVAWSKAIGAGSSARAESLVNKTTHIGGQSDAYLAVDTDGELVSVSLTLLPNGESANGKKN